MLVLFLLCAEDENGVTNVEHVTHDVNRALEYIRCSHFKRIVIPLDVHDERLFDDRNIQNLLKRKVGGDNHAV